MKWQMCRFQQYKSIGEIVQNKSGTHNSNTDIGSHKINDDSAEETHQTQGRATWRQPSRTWNWT